MTASRFANHMGVSLLILWAVVLPQKSTSLRAEEKPAADVPSVQRIFDDHNPLKGFDAAGRQHMLSGSDRGVAIVFLATECPLSNKYIPELNRLAEQFASGGVKLYGIVSDPATTRPQVAKHAEEYALQFPLLFDASGDLAKRLRPKRTPEAFVVAPDGTLVYRGRIDDGYESPGHPRARVSTRDLADAVDALVSDSAPALRVTEPIGCLVEGLGESAGHKQATYSRDISPILWNNCCCCHRPGQVAPFSLTSYADAAKHALQLSEAASSRYMPPWKAEPGFGHFVGERRLTDTELALLTTWAEGGAPEGDPVDTPPPQEYSSDWQLGTPDMVVSMSAPFTIPADGPNIFRWFAIPLDIPKDRMIRAVEFRAANPKVVHHVLIFLDTTGKAVKLDAKDPEPGYSNFGGPGFMPGGFLGSWSSGHTPHELPAGLGMPLPRKSVIVLQVHYAPTGKVEQDQSSIGLYFSDRADLRKVTTIPVLSLDIDIPAGAPRHEVNCSITLPVDLEVVGLTPHMHYIGREMKVVAVPPDGGDPLPLIWIKDWDFNWQDQYQLAEPLPLSKGTRIEVSTFYDNTEENRLNPFSPPQRVVYGSSSTDEMCLLGVQVAIKNQGDMLVLAESMVRQFLKSREGKPFVNPFE